MTQRINHYEADDLIITVDVVFQRGAQITSLTGGTVEAYARKGGTTVTGSASVLTSTSARVSFAEGALSVGQWELQVRVTVGSITQTIADAIIVVKDSI